MASQTGSIVKRLREAESPHCNTKWEKKDGYYTATCRVSTNDIPSLIDIACKWSDPDWPDNDLGLGEDLDDIQLLPVTAWRTLADLKASECVEPLINMLCELDVENDDWASNELPHVFGKIGQPAIEAVLRIASDVDRHCYIRSAAAEALQRVAENHVETRDEVVTCLAEILTQATQSDIHFNSTVLVGLVELRAVEAAETIERAFANDHLDVATIGDWEVVRRELGVEGLRLEMPKHPHNSIGQLRRRMGMGIFSSEQIFDYQGERNSDAEQAYYERAWEVFSKSNEAQQVLAREDDLGWFQMFLKFGLEYLGEIVDEMTVVTVEEFVFEYIPRKVSTEPERAASIVFELTMFWKYIDRVFELPDAKSIIEWLGADRLVATLEARLSDSTSFGMAKSMFMSGTNAGYDMTSEKGMAEFVAAYNHSNAGATSRRASPVTSRQRVGRNDPCPCGSGKKFKKCCR